eukprot:40344-Eustigmatos_ZCMA.PRE.1
MSRFKKAHRKPRLKVHRGNIQDCRLTEDIVDGERVRGRWAVPPLVLRGRHELAQLVVVVHLARTQLLLLPTTDSWMAMPSVECTQIRMLASPQRACISQCGRVGYQVQTHMRMTSYAYVYGGQ